MFTEIKKISSVGLSRPYDVRKATALYFVSHPVCEICGKSEIISVHHIRPYSKFPELATDFSNMISLCDDRSNTSSCHLKFGHNGDFNNIDYNVGSLRKSSLLPSL
jgi:hypothetical protein